MGQLDNVLQEKVLVKGSGYSGISGMLMGNPCSLKCVQMKTKPFETRIFGKPTQFVIITLANNDRAVNHHSQ
jgi:hypothetical protein